MTAPGNPSLELDLKALIRDVPDFPKPGIVFKDLTPVWRDPLAFKAMADRLAAPYRSAGVEVVAGIESRGLILAAALAYTLGAGLVPIRKEGKLPWRTVKASYALEYGQATTELHADAFAPETRVLIVDDLLATGGTAEAAVQLVRRLKGQIVAAAFLVELTFLKGRQRLEAIGVEVSSLIRYDRP
jgi:adenine phosphoribosyltransferase